MQTHQQKLETQRRWRNNNRDKVRRYNRANVEKRREQVASYMAQYRKDNKDRMRDLNAAWKKRNPGYRKNIKYRITGHMGSCRQKAKWLGVLHPKYDASACRLFYVERHRLEALTGEPHSVDHIIPMVHGGWHHQDNLQVLPLRINLSKHSNPLWEYPGYKSWRDVPKYLWPSQLAEKYEKLI